MRALQSGARHGPVLVATLAALVLSGRVGPVEADLVQVNAPSINSASPDLLDLATSPEIAGMALDQRLQRGPDRRALTFNLTPLALLDLVRRAQAATPSSASGWAGRAVARVTLGGPPQFIDSLRVAHAGRATNHVTSELKLRVLDSLGNAPWARPVKVAVALTADNLGTGYGLDRYGGTLIAEREAACTVTANAGYRVLERYHAAERMGETKLGLGAAWHSMRLKALDLGFSGACLLRNHGRAPVWQGGARADLAVDGLRLSLATRRSDHPEVRGGDRGRSVLSLAYDLAGR